MKNRIKKIAIKVIVISMLSAMPILANSLVVQASGSTENEFLEVIIPYPKEDVIVENGIALYTGETLDVSTYPNWKLSNDGIVEIDENGKLTAISEGTVFLTQEFLGKVHITEIGVLQRETAIAYNTRSLLAASSMKSVNRNYYKVFIDPGHGGSDPGALGNGYEEDDLNLSIAKKVESRLKAKGIQVKMSRYTDEYINLADRGPMANEYGADVFVSIHQNSATPEANGIETFYHTEKSLYKPYAERIQNNAINETRATNRGIKTADFAVLRQSNMVSALIECGFITNVNEANNLANSTYQDKLATAISNGVETYLKENIKLDTVDSNDTVIATGTVTAASLNVRGGPSTSYSQIGTLSNGSKVEILETLNGWHKIKFNDGYGYISASYIQLDSSTPPPADTVLDKGKIGNYTTNVRSEAGFSYSKLGYMSPGSNVEILEVKGGWYKIKFLNGIGYVPYNSVTLNGLISPPPSNTVLDKGKIGSYTINVRSGTGFSYSKLGYMSPGSNVEILEIKNGWYKIKFLNGTGYIPHNSIIINGSTTVSLENIVLDRGKIGSYTTDVRSGTGFSYSKLGYMSPGSNVEILEVKNGWYKIKFLNGTGYIPHNNIIINSSTTASSENIVLDRGKIGSYTTDVRKGAGTSYSKLGYMSPGSRVEILEVRNEWYKIKFLNGIGYIPSKSVIIGY